MFNWIFGPNLRSLVLYPGVFPAFPLAYRLGLVFKYAWHGRCKRVNDLSRRSYSCPQPICIPFHANLHQRSRGYPMGLLSCFFCHCLLGGLAWLLIVCYWPSGIWEVVYFPLIILNSKVYFLRPHLGLAFFFSLIFFVYLH